MMLLSRIVLTLNTKQSLFQQNEFAYMDKVTNLSQYLMQFDKSYRKSTLRALLKSDQSFHSLLQSTYVYLPTDVHYRVV